MNNSWNALIYKAWSPVYDKVFDSGPFLTARKTLFDNNGQQYWQAGQDILFVGVGTGADLAHIDHETVNITRRRCTIRRRLSKPLSANSLRLNSKARAN